MTITIPAQLRQLITDSPFEPATTALVEATRTLLDDNTMPFFPAFTDHGAQHVENVLSAAARLIPERVWNGDLLMPADGAVLICAALLHDIALHIREHGFVELMSGDRFKPTQWFDHDQVGRSADLPWPQMWSLFQREARHFGTSQLELLFGPGVEEVPAVAHEEELDPQRWREADHLLIGEFIRRNHARISHEVALFGLPGDDDGEGFPVLGKSMPELADAVGALARSHNEPLRRMLEYLAFLEPGSKRPEGALLPYHMAILRVADYLQLTAHRAPPLLMRLKEPVSPVSIEEWNKHDAVTSIDWEHDDPKGIFVRVSANHTLRTHLALADLLRDLQAELDTATAVLSVVYPTGKLSALRLTRQRVLTNLFEPSLQERLPFVARRASLESDKDLFRLVIGHIYGNQPAVAGRELVQNAVDAVRARRAAEDRTGQLLPEGLLRDQAAEVVVEVRETGSGQCTLRVADRGIGMTPDLVIDYYLRAGASFGPTPTEIGELEREEALARMKAGRFGVGAFAAFLLGPEIRVTTRHIDADRGVTFTARIDEDLVQLNWADDVPIGTEVQIDFLTSVLPGPRWARSDPGTPGEFLRTVADFYRLDDPEVSFSLSLGGREEEVEAPKDVPAPGEKSASRWRSVEVEGYGGVRWYPGGGGSQLVHNGIEIRDLLSDSAGASSYQWSTPTIQSSLRLPRLAIFDSRHLFQISLNRYSLLDPVLPFESQLLESIGADMLARALVLGPGKHPLEQHRCSPIYARAAWLPCVASLLGRYLDDRLLVLWHWERGSSTLPTGELLRADSMIPWESFPYRAHVRIPVDEPEQITMAASKLGVLLGGRPLATVITGMPTHLQFRDVGRDRRLYPFEKAGSSLTKGPGDDHATEAELRKLANGMRERGIARVVLSVFGEFSGGPEGDAPLGAAWCSNLDGMLSRDPRSRQAKSRLILESDPKLADLAESWRGLSPG